MALPTSQGNRVASFKTTRVTSSSSPSRAFIILTSTRVKTQATDRHENVCLWFNKQRHIPARAFLAKFSKTFGRQRPSQKTCPIKDMRNGARAVKSIIKKHLMPTSSLVR